MALQSSFRRVVVLLALAAVLAFALPLAPSAAAPVAADPATYSTCGRVFPDPHAYWPLPAPPEDDGPRSPWAKGNATCPAVDFLGWDETLSGLNFLASEGMFGDFVEVYNLGEADALDFTVEDEFADVLAEAGVDGMTAGLPTETLDRDKVPMYLVRVTDEQIDAARDNTTPIEDRQHFAYALSIHGIERAGIEGGIRAIEDLATWASCEKHGDAGSPANCAQENASIGIDDPDAPHPIMETIPNESTTAGDALKQQSVWFLLSNPDGWRRGDKQKALQEPEPDGQLPGFFYQRYNGNGVDLNRDWPAMGFTFRPYTPWSEPETRAVGEVLKSVKDKWTGGIDLHGQLNARAFSFTLIGGSERPFDKDRRVLQFVKGAWADAEQRLSWSPLIVPNDEERPTEAHMYGVQWGTIWDTINYTTTGALGDWMDSPLGLDADGIDNEMSFSHLSNCGVGTCFLTEFEQLHVDGNKSLIYAQMHYSLLPEDTTFNYDGKAGYLHNPNRVSDPGSDESTAPAYTDLPPQEPESFTMNHPDPGEVDRSTHEFMVKGPESGVFNGGIRAVITSTNVDAVSASSLNEIAIDRRRPAEQDPDRGQETEDDWQTMNSYFNQSFLYLQSGAQLDVNSPLPGLYRVRIEGVDPSQFDVDLEFLREQAWPDPGQRPYDVSNMDFFTMLQDHVPSADKLRRLTVDSVVDGSADLNALDTVVVTDDAFLPGYVEPRPGVPAQDQIVEDVECVCAPGAGARSSPGTSVYFEFDVERPQQEFTAEVESSTVVDPDLYLQKQQEDGSWSGDLASGATGRTLYETLTYGQPEPGHYRLEIHNWAGAPGPVQVQIDFKGLAAQVNNSAYTTADKDRLVKILDDFVRGGGNLVLTDNGLRTLGWMGLAPEDAVSKHDVYAGHVEFLNAEGEASYDDPLAANVNQPGAAEGSGHRHQVAEPVPTGFAIQDEGGGDLSTHPQWTVNRDAFEKAGGRIVGQLGENEVTLGEIKHGKGVVRILGSLLPTPTEKYDHPFGLESYGVTYSGYEVFRNLLDWDRDTGSGGTDPEPPPDDDTGPTDDDLDDGTGPADDDRPILPATGGGIVLAALVTLGTGLVVRRRMRVRR